MTKFAFALAAAAVTTVTVTAVTTTPAAAHDRAPFASARVEAGVGSDAVRSHDVPAALATVDGPRRGAAAG